MNAQLEAPLKRERGRPVLRVLPKPVSPESVARMNAVWDELRMPWLEAFSGRCAGRENEAQFYESLEHIKRVVDQALLEKQATLQRQVL